MYPPNGTSEDLLAILARGCLAREGSRPGGALSDAWEAACILAGRAAGTALSLAPRAWAERVEDRLFLALEGGRRLPFDEASPALGRAGELLRSEAAAGRRPAVLCLLSHPPVTAELRHLNLELTRHALLGLRRLRPESRPRVVNAVDLFAVDMLRVHERGAYAGFMASRHLGIDRLARMRTRPGRLLLGGSAWPAAPFRIAKALTEGGELAMVLGGGVPATGRIMYCARELLHRLREERPMPKAAPREVLRRLLASSEDFASFHASPEVGAALKRGAWRMMESWVISILARPDLLGQAEEGALPAAAMVALTACARALGWADEGLEPVLGEFAREYVYETPSRERLFRFLARRIAARGAPILLLPLTHGRLGDPRMRFGEPVLLAGALPSVRDFSREFVRSRFR